MANQGRRKVPEKRKDHFDALAKGQEGGGEPGKQGGVNGHSHGQMGLGLIGNRTRGVPFSFWR